MSIFLEGQQGWKEKEENLSSVHFLSLSFLVYHLNKLRIEKLKEETVLSDGS